MDVGERKQDRRRKGRFFYAFYPSFSILFLGVCFLWTASPAQAVSDNQTMPLTFSIEPVRVVRAEATSGGASVDLGSVVPGVEVPAQTVQVSVITNTETAYSVYHELRNDMTNQSGARLPDESFRYRVMNGAQGTESRVPSWETVPEGRRLIARSSGGGDTFTVNYKVEGKGVLEAGDYYGNAKITVEDA